MELSSLKEISGRKVKTFVFSFKLQLVFLLLKEQQMAVLGGRRGKKKKIDSDNHSVAAFPTRRYDRLQDVLADQRVPPLSSQSCPATQRRSRKLVLLWSTRRADRRPRESSATRRQSPD